MSGESGGKWASNTILESQGLPSCGNNDCNQNSLPSAWEAEKNGILYVNASGTITDDKGAVTQIKTNPIKIEISIKTDTNINEDNQIIDNSSSFVFILPDTTDPARPENLHLKDLVSNLNIASKHANATFSIGANNSLVMTCKEGYTSRNDISWGHLSKDNPFMGTAVAYFDMHDIWHTQDYNDWTSNIQFGFNNGNGNIMFELGCWKKPTTEIH